MSATARREPLVATAYLPPTSLMALLAQNPTAQIEACESYPKQTYRNRATIATGGGLLDLTVPVVYTHGNHTPTSQMGIDYSRCWPTTHLRTLDAAYSASPYYQYYRDELESLIAARYGTLMELNSALLQFLLKKMKIDCRLRLTTDFERPTGASHDWRQLISPKRPLKGFQFEPYTQVFADRMPFVPNLSAIDLLCNLGPDSGRYLRHVTIIDQDI